MEFYHEAQPTRKGWRSRWLRSYEFAKFSLPGWLSAASVDRWRARRVQWRRPEWMWVPEQPRSRACRRAACEPPRCLRGRLQQRAVFACRRGEPATAVVNHRHTIGSSSNQRCLNVARLSVWTDFLHRWQADWQLVRTAVARGSRYQIDQVHDADGDPALQKSGDGSQSDLDSLAGVQPTPHGHGRCRQRERHRATQGKFQGRQVSLDRPRSEDRSCPASRSGVVD